MKPALAFFAAIAVLALSGCNGGKAKGFRVQVSEEEAKAADAKALEDWAEWYVQEHGWPPSDLGDFYQWQEAQLAERLLRQAEAAAKAGPTQP